MKMRTLLVLVGMSVACGAEGDYSSNDLQLITVYTAKTACSCLFVMEQTEEHCRAWTKQSPAIATWSVDMESKTVESAAGLFWGASARFDNDKFGCIVE